VVNATDYYPFGMMMPNRIYSANGSYRYGFNGKENDNEVKAEGNEQDYGKRICDPRIGRFLSVDPLSKSYPEVSPYQFASNRPIDGGDLDGLEFEDKKTILAGVASLRNTSASNTQNVIINQVSACHGVENPNFQGEGGSGWSADDAHWSVVDSFNRTGIMRDRHGTQNSGIWGTSQDARSVTNAPTARKSTNY
jgi:RHS repeat-associated protein